jgi:urea transport system substrate-binding protein
MPAEMQRRSFLRLAGGIGTATMFAPLVAACGAPGGGGDDDSDEMKLGFLTALTGLETILGKTQFQCFELAVKQINEEGGIAGRQIRVIREDNASDSQQTIDKATKLALQDEVTAVVGLITSLEKEAALSVLPGQNTPLFYTTYYEGSYLEAKACDDLYVGMGQVPNQQIDPLVPWLTENVGRSYYIVGSDYIWPRATSVRLKELVKEAGGEIVGEQYYPFGTTDFSRVFRELNTLKPDICWAPLAGADFMTFLNQYSQFEAEPRLVSIGMDDVFAHENPGVGAGTIASQAYFMTLDNPENQAFLEAYQEAYGEDAPVNAIGEAAYNSVWLIKNAIEHVDGSLDPSDWVPALSEVSFAAPSGEVRISADNQHVVAGNYIGEVQQDGSINILDEEAAVEPVVPGCSL